MTQSVSEPGGGWWKGQHRCLRSKRPRQKAPICLEANRKRWPHSFDKMGLINANRKRHCSEYRPFRDLPTLRISQMLVGQYIQWRSFCTPLDLNRRAYGRFARFVTVSLQYAWDRHAKIFKFLTWMWANGRNNLLQSWKLTIFADSPLVGVTTQTDWVRNGIGNSGYSLVSAFLENNWWAQQNRADFPFPYQPGSIRRPRRRESEPQGSCHICSPFIPFCTSSWWFWW